MRRLSVHVCFLLGLLALPVVTRGGEKQPIDLPNPSFEKGTDGYWISDPAAAAIDPDTSSAGERSLCLFPDSRKAVETVLHVPWRAGMVYRLGFDSKRTGGEQGPALHVSTMLKGAAPIMFWPPNAEAEKFIEVSPTGEWSRRELLLGPFPKEAQGKTVGSVAVYFETFGGPAEGKLWIDNLVVGVEPEGAAGAKQEKQAAAAAAPAPAAVAPAPTRADDKHKNTAEKLNDMNAKLIRFEFPAAVRLFEQPVTVKVSAPSAPGGATLALELADCKGRITDSRSADAHAGVETPAAAPGYYRATASLLAEGRLLARASTSFLVTTPLPADYFSTPHPAFGVWAGVTDEMLRVAGAKWTRHLSWPQFQPTDFKGTPPSPETLKARSPVKMIKQLNVLDAFKKMVPVPKDEWPAILDKVGKEITASRGLVDVWETQNEPMVDENFFGSMEDVVEIIDNTSRLVRTLDPGTPIAGICINPMIANQYAQIIGYYKRLGMAKQVDAVMLHPYIPNAAAPDSSGYVETLRRLGRELKEITGAEVPLSISEIGYSTKPGGEVSELEQAAYLTRVVLLNRQIEGLRACVWHCGLWNDAPPGRELDYGILRPHPKDSPVREPKPAFAAWATVSRQTYNADYLGEIEFGRGIRAFLFSRDSRPLIVAYSLSKTPKTIKVPLAGDRIVVTDLCGTSAELPISAGVAELELDETPLYIAGSDPQDVQRLSRLEVSFSPEEVKVKPGDRLELKMSGAPLALDGAELKVETPPGWSVSSSGTGESRVVELTLPPNALPGEQTLFIHLVKNGESKHIWRREMQIMPPVESRR